MRRHAASVARNVPGQRLDGQIFVSRPADACVERVARPLARSPIAAAQVEVDQFVAHRHDDHHGRSDPPVANRELLGLVQQRLSEPTILH